MRNLVLLFLRYNFVLYFIVLELICASLIIQNNDFHKSSFINSSNFIAGGLYDKAWSMKQFFSLRQQNIALLDENASLKKIHTKISDIHPSDSLVNLSEDTLSQYIYIPAIVVNNSVNKRMNYLTINKGSKHGIKKEMGVIDQNGIVGVVHNVSANYATIRSILHSESMISAGLKRTAYYGSLVWKGNNPTIVRLKDIPKHANIQIGDSVVTTTYSSIFPHGIPIGTVKEVIDRDELSFKELDVKLINDLANSVYVYAIENKLKEEKIELEKLNDN